MGDICWFLSKNNILHLWWLICATPPFMYCWGNNTAAQPGEMVTNMLFWQCCIGAFILLPFHIVALLRQTWQSAFRCHFMPPFSPSNNLPTQQLMFWPFTVLSLGTQKHIRRKFTNVNWEGFVSHSQNLCWNVAKPYENIQWPVMNIWDYQ